MDPFSIASGAAGFISLGLTIADGLVQFCRDYRSRDEDLAQLTQHTQQFQSFLTLIQNHTTGGQSPDGDTITAARACQSACEACLGEFKRLAGKYAGPDQASTVSSRSLLRKMKYPFDKRKFEDIRSRLRDFNIELFGYLQLASLDHTREIRIGMVSESSRVTAAVETVGREISSSISHAENAVQSRIHDGVSQLEVSFQQGLRRAEDNVTGSMAVSLHYLSDSFSQGQTQQTSMIMGRLDQVLQMLQNQNVTQATNFATETRMTLGTLNMNDTHQDGRATRNASPVATLIDNLCDCPRARRGFSAVQHRNGCVYSFSNRRRRTFTWRIGAFWRQAIATVELEYSPFAWARDLRICPSLTLRATVPQDAPAFQTIFNASRLFLADLSTENVEVVSQNYLVELRRTFSSGKGCPTDVDYMGLNILHRAIILFGRMRVRRFSSALAYEKRADYLWQLIIALRHMGVPINDDDDGVTPLSMLLSSPTLDPAIIKTDIAHRAIGIGALGSTTVRNHIEVLTRLFFGIDDLYEPLASTQFLHEVLLHSESEVVRLLRRDPSLLYNHTHDGQTPFHLATNWPNGLSILIECAQGATTPLINIRDRFGFTALDYAVRLGEPASVRLLIDAGATIEQSFRPLSQMVDTTERATIIGIIVESLVLQRRQLLALALRYLSPEEIEKLGLKESVLLDCKAFDVSEALRQRQVLIPPTYDTLKPGSVYHWRGLDVFIAQKLFDSGFHQTDTEYCGHTPLMVQIEPSSKFSKSLELILWFEDHGAALHAPIPLPKCHVPASSTRGIAPVYPTIHRILFNLSFESRHVKGSLPLEHISLLRKLLSDKYTDPCLCYCTTGGCTSISKFAQGFGRSLIYMGKTERFERMKLLEKALSTDYDGHATASCLMRALTFSGLGMTHTCCIYFYDFGLEWNIDNGSLELMDPAEIDEIREEERYLAELLDTLMEEFDAKFQEMNVALSEFVESYWLPRMEEVMEERDELSAANLQAIRETGVVLDES